MSAQNINNGNSSKAIKSALAISLYALLGLRLITSLILLIGIIEPPSVLPKSEYTQAYMAELDSESSFSKYLLAPWYRWDTAHYIEIADQGYDFDPVNSVWPPLYPFLIKLITYITQNSLLSALLISSLFTLLSFFMLYRYTSIRFNEYTAKKAVFYLAIFPTSFYLVAGYTESLFLFFSISVFYFLHKKEWLIAGLISCFAAMVRLQGIFLIIPIFIELILQYKDDKDVKAFFTQAFSMVLAPAFYIFFVIYVHFGLKLDWPWKTLGEHWGQHMGLPWEGIIGNIMALFGREIVFDTTLPIIKILTLIITFSSIYFLIRIYKNIPLSLFIYSTLSMLIFLGKVDNQSIMVSTIRYVIVLFPIFISQALFIKKKWVMNTIFIFSFAVEILLLVFFYWWIWVA